ncbi:MAG: FAD-binding oxidoreductase [Bryobacteraceae bacterium]
MDYRQLTPAVDEAMFHEFQQILGEDAVDLRPERLQVASTALFHTTQTVPAILRPATREQVQQCVRLANRLGIRLYPLSTGRNWGYGSTVPPVSDTAIVDLGRMRKILDYSEENAYVTVEPGVTQQQLFDFLAERGSRLWMDCTGASPKASVVANALERGFGHSPYADHFAHACNLEVVLPDGDCIETGHGRFGAASSPTYRWGSGAVLDGLFSQSNLGIVTRCTLWLMPKPDHFEAFFFRCDDEQGLASIIDALRPLRLDGSLKSGVHIGNAYKVLAGLRQYPWEETGGRTPLRPEVLARLSGKMQFGAWNASGGLYGTRAQVAESRRLLRRALRGKVRKLTFVNERLLTLAERIAPLFHLVARWDLRRTIDLVRPLFGLLQGVPTDYPLRSVYWRKRTPPPDDMDPNRDRCGLIWCAPVAPTRGEHATRLASIATEVLLRHGFEPMISITLLTERTLACIVSISYDRDVAGEDERAMACHDAAMAAFRAAGYHFYRLGIQSMSHAASPGDYSALMAKLKNAMDPAGILAPGRYEGP